jgi:hypothetical protein
MADRNPSRPFSADPSPRAGLGLPRITTGHIRGFAIDPRWFRRRPAGIHGLGHEIRVLIWTQLLAEMVGREGLSADAAVVGWAAAVHDTQRVDDGDDRGHGTRAADWLAAHSDILPPTVPIARVLYLCRWHVPPDPDAPEMTPELQVFKDADALDRWRIYDLDPSRLRTVAARQLLRPSQALWAATADVFDPKDAFARILAAAEALGIIASD